MHMYRVKYRQDQEFQRQHLYKPDQDEKTSITVYPIMYVHVLLHTHSACNGKITASLKKFFLVTKTDSYWRLAVPRLPVLHSLLCVPDCLESVEALVQQERRIVDEHIDEPHEGRVVLGVCALCLDGGLVDRMLPELFQDHTDVVTDAELVKEFV